MLVELHIENFAIIDRLDINFGPGLVIFSGETGAGKSIIIDAVETLLGGRADATFVRSGSQYASVEGIFQLSETTRNELADILERENLLEDPHYLTLGREIRTTGRNVTRVNGRSVSAAILRELGEYLVDVHGQSEHLSLLRVRQHLNLLDSYLAAEQGKGFSDVLDEYQQTYQRLQAMQRELKELQQSERDAARRTDMLNFQINEIQAARLRQGEEEELLSERTRLANAENLTSLVQIALQALDEGTPEAPAATDLFGQAAHALTGLARLDASQSSLSDQAQAISESLADLSASLRSYQEEIEFNPRRLDQVEERLALIHTLKRKYGDTIPAILTFAEQAHSQLETITHAAERIVELEADRQALLEALGQQGLALSEKRHTAARSLEEKMEGELNDLNMAGARFQVAIEQSEDPLGVPLPDGRCLAYSASGLEKIEFLIAPNPGEGFKPLAKIASGGETSRLMLALKNVLARADHVPTLIFDEIDQGIGGRVGGVVGEKLWSLARQHQVLCITHLPQLAAYGEQHYHVQKEVDAGRTATLVKSLDGPARLVELAQMLGDVTDGTLQSASEILESVSQKTKRP
jgi:DNA repair protein RecN (Recombination protein N)